MLTFPSRWVYLPAISLFTSQVSEGTKKVEYFPLFTSCISEGTKKVELFPGISRNEKGLVFSTFKRLHPEQTISQVFSTLHVLGIWMNKKGQAISRYLREQKRLSVIHIQLNRIFISSFNYSISNCTSSIYLRPEKWTGWKVHSCMLSAFLSALHAYIMYFRDITDNMYNYVYEQNTYTVTLSTSMRKHC